MSIYQSCNRRSSMGYTASCGRCLDLTMEVGKGKRGIGNKLEKVGVSGKLPRLLDMELRD